MRKSISSSVSRASGKARLRSAVAIACAGCLYASIAAAQVGVDGSSERTSDVTLRLGSARSDNVFRRTTNETSGSYTALGALVDISRETNRLTADVSGDIELRSYSTADADDAPYGELDARLEFEAVPERFSWLVLDQYGQGRIDPFTAIAPDNREQINVFSTGPALYVPVGGRTELRLAGQKGRRTYGDSTDFDNDTLESSIGIFRDMSTTTEIGLSLSTRDVEYDNPLADNTIDRAYFSYRKTLANGEASAQFGSNRVDILGSTETYPFFNLGWARDVTTRTTLAFDIQNSLVDAGDSFRGGRSFFDSLRTTDVYERTTGGVALRLDTGRSQFVIGGRFGEDRYENETTLNNDLLQLNFSFERTISALMTAGFSVGAVDREFKSVDQKDEDSTASLWCERMFGRQLSLSVSYDRDQRAGRNSSSYDENTIRVMVQYALNGGANAR